MLPFVFGSEFRKNIAQVVSANVFTQVLALLLYPLITRLYSPEEFGAFNIVLSIAAVFYVLSTARYESAIVQPKKHTDAAAVLQFSFLLNTVVSLLLAVVVFFFQNQLKHVFSLESVGFGIYFLPLFVFFNGVGLLWTRWFNRIKAYQHMASYQIIQSLTNSLGKLGFGWLGFTQVGLLLATSLGFVVSFFFGFFTTGFRRFRVLLCSCKWSRMKELALRYADYPKYSMPRAFINMLSGNLPLLLLAPYFGEGKVGFFALAMAVGFRPINLVGTSLNQVLFQRVVEQYNSHKSIYPLIKNICIKLFALFFPLFILLYVFLTPAVEFLFGQTWSETAYNLQILLPYLFLNVFSTSLVFLPVVFFKQKQLMVFELVHLACRTLALLLGVVNKDFYLGIIAFSWVSVIFIVLQLVWFYTFLRSYESKRAQ